MHWILFTFTDFPDIIDSTISSNIKKVEAAEI